MGDTRISKEEWLMHIARAVSYRATCDRARVGCVLARDNHIIATGYNGSPSGFDHCNDVGHLILNGHCVRTVHAEKNALLQCAKFGIATEGALCFCTMQPCIDCTRDLFVAGIKHIFFQDDYATMSEFDRSRLEEFIKHGLTIERINNVEDSRLNRA